MPAILSDAVIVTSTESLKKLIGSSLSSLFITNEDVSYVIFRSTGDSLSTQNDFASAFFPLYDISRV